MAKRCSTCREAWVQMSGEACMTCRRPPYRRCLVQCPENRPVGRDRGPCHALLFQHEVEEHLRDHGVEPDEGKWTELVAERREPRVDERSCDCGAAKQPSQRVCDECRRSEARGRTAKPLPGATYDELKEAGLCPRCRESPPERVGGVYCRVCLDALAGKTRDSRARRRWGMSR
jgi:hypothetical protein